MAIKEYRPVTPAQRFKTRQDNKDLTRKSPEKSLVRGRRRVSGRSRGGTITVRRRGGGAKRRYREIDFRRKKDEVAGRIASVEYDPNRSARIALVKYVDGEKRYIIAPLNIKVGDEVISGEKPSLKIGNTLPLRKIPTGSFIHNLQFDPDKEGQLVRAAGTYAQILAKEGQIVHVRLPSGEVRKFSVKCRATLGQVGNVEHSSIVIGNAGARRHLGRRPKVRGVAMNPIDHPLGGGEGRSAGGGVPRSPWGKRERKTRKKNKASDKYIVKRRK